VKAKRAVVMWTAAADQIGHAYEHSRRRPAKALCGVRLVPERLAWPPVVRCPDCLSAAGISGVPMAN
jgi:hypothetical protein